ncbi:hypothetical protein ACQ4PT_040020 [Festuca glaucescens]
MAASAGQGERATSFAMACNLLSQYVRKNGAAAVDLGLGINKVEAEGKTTLPGAEESGRKETMELFPQSAGLGAVQDAAAPDATSLSESGLDVAKRYLGVKVDKIRVHLFDGASYDATVVARDDHWNLLALCVRFSRAVKTMEMAEISENTMGAIYHHVQPVHFDSARVMLSPGDTTIGLGRLPEETFGLQANRGVYTGQRWSNRPTDCQEMQKATFINTYTAIGGPAIDKNGQVIGILFHNLDSTPFLPSNVILKWWDHFKKSAGKYCRPKIRVFGVNLRQAQTSAWGKVPKSLYEGFDGFFVEHTSRAVRTAGLRKNDLIIQCNGKYVATSLQLFVILAENVGKTVEVTFVKAEDGKTRSVLLPVEETLRGDFHWWTISQYPDEFWRILVLVDVS